VPPGESAAITFPFRKGTGSYPARALHSAELTPPGRVCRGLRSRLEHAARTQITLPANIRVECGVEGPHLLRKCSLQGLSAISRWFRCVRVRNFIFTV
jgi:hypothetical protein